MGGVELTGQVMLDSNVVWMQTAGRLDPSQEVLSFERLYPWILGAMLEGQRQGDSCKSCILLLLSFSSFSLSFRNILLFKLFSFLLIADESSAYIVHTWRLKKLITIKTHSSCIGVKLIISSKKSNMNNIFFKWTIMHFV